MGLHKILKYVALGLGVIGMILLARVIFAGNDAIKASADVQASVVDPYIFISYVVLAIVLVLVLIYVLKGIFAGNIKKTLMAIGAFLAVFVIAYVLSNGVETPMKDGKILSESGSKLVGTGLRMFYILTIIAIGAMAWTGVKKLTNK